MNLTGFDLYHYSLPLRSPLTLRGTSLQHRVGLLLRLSGDDGSEGWGESAPLPGFSVESVDEAAAQLRLLTRSLVGREVTGDWMDIDGEFCQGLDRADALPSARFGLELAVWNLYAASAGLSLPGLIAPQPRPTVSVNGLLSGEPDLVFEEARRRRDAGYSAVKLKVGARGVAEDVRLVHALGGLLGDVISLRLDANRAWGYGEAAEFLRGTSRFEYIEEPLVDPRGLPRLVEEFGVPVALDESLVGMEPEELEDHGYARAVVLKPTLLGGITRTLRVAEQALRLGITPVTSSAYESGVGTAALVALAAGIGEQPVPAGLDTYRTLAEDVLDTPLALPSPSVDVARAAEASRSVGVGKLQRI